MQCNSVIKEVLNLVFSGIRISGISGIPYYPTAFSPMGGAQCPHKKKKKNLIFSGRVEYQKDPENFWLTCPCFQNDISHIKTNFIDFLNADIQIALLGWSIPTNSYLLMHSFWVQIYWLKSTFGKQKSI